MSQITAQCDVTSCNRISSYRLCGGKYFLLFSIDEGAVDLSENLMTGYNTSKCHTQKKIVFQRAVRLCLFLFLLMQSNAFKVFV
jgi:hypothetical protein